MGKAENALASMLDEPYRDYWPALGKFIHEFSGMESLLHELAIRVAGVSDNLGKAIFSGLRIDNAKDALNRMYEASGDQAAKDRMAPVFAQIGAIAGMRNNIVHWGAQSVSRDDGFEGLLVSNARIAHTKERLRTFVVSAEMLTDMRVDISKISMHLLVELFRDREGAKIAPTVTRVLEAPWRYKSPPQSPAQRKPRAPHQKSRAPRPSSPE